MVFKNEMSEELTLCNFKIGFWGQSVVLDDLKRSLSNLIVLQICINNLPVTWKGDH